VIYHVDPEAGQSFVISACAALRRSEPFDLSSYDPGRFAMLVFVQDQPGKPKVTSMPELGTRQIIHMKGVKELNIVQDFDS
jgi:hypothetical protein